MLRKLAASISAIFIYSFVVAQTHTPVYLSQSITNANSKGFYRYLPADYSSSTKKYPLIIWLHGAGQVGQGNTTDLPKVLTLGLPKVITDGGFPANFTVGDSTFSFIVISPQFIAWPSGANLGGIINYVLSNYRVDTDRIYLLGMSAGGGAVWEYTGTSIANSDRIAAIIPFAGAFVSSQTMANRIAASKLPVWAFHNTHDGTIPVSYSRGWRNGINNYTPATTPAPILTEFPIQSPDPIIAHDCWTNTTVPTYRLNGKNIYEWLLQYRKRTVTQNISPIASAGDDASVIVPGSFTLNGSQSIDPDGTITSYRWRKVSGPTQFNISDSTIANPVISGVVDGTYTFQLTVTDNQNATASDQMQLLAYTSTTPGGQKRVLIDAGVSNISTTSPASTGYYWNNMTDARPGVRVSNARTTDNGTSAITLEVINRIDGTYNTAGTGMNSVNSVGTVGIYPSSATNDYAFAHRTTTAGRWRIRGLDASKLYQIKFWGSKSGETTGRDIEIKRSDESVWKTYSAASNTNFNNAAFFTVTSKSEVDFDIRVKSPGEFGYINVIDIMWDEGSTQNQPPVANAGADVTITVPASTTVLNGCNSTDPENGALTYSWSKISGGAATISSSSVCNPQVSGLAAGVYTYELVVSDTGQLVDKDTVIITVNPPVSMNWPGAMQPTCPQPYKLVILGSSTAFGTGASPIDSSWVNKFRTYQRRYNTQINVTNLSLGGYTTYQICPDNFVPPANRPSPDTERNITAALALQPDGIIVNMPSNDAAGAFTVQESQNNFNLVVSMADAANVPIWIATTQPRNGLPATQTNSLITMKNWILQRFGNKAIDFWTDIANADGTIAAAFNSGDGVHLNNYGHHILFTRAVTEKVWDTICNRRALATNLPPVANAGADIQTSALPVSINGSASFDPEGMPLSYSWRILYGATGTIANGNVPQTNFSAPSTGSYYLELTVTDNVNKTDKDTVGIFYSISNVLPVANAGSDILIHLPQDSAMLSGSNSMDQGGEIISYAWQQINGTTVSAFAQNTANTWLRDLDPGMYSFELIVTDDSLTTDKDTVVVFVNSPPLSDAGDDQQITLPSNLVTVSGVASSDLEGPVSFQWRKISGPSGGVLANASAGQTTISFTNAGSYSIELLVTDTHSRTDKDTVVITVLPDPNQAPVASAGNAASIQLPLNNVLLQGTASYDPDGTIASYAWSFVSGPAGSQLVTPALDTCRAIFANAGTYVFRLLVTDNNGATASANVTITVNAAPSTAKIIRVNVFNGTTPYNNPAWNNWAPVNNTNSAALKYEDGTNSAVVVRINEHKISDNGAGYGAGATSCPAEVLRFSSMHTITRTLTVSGLNAAYRYNFDFYGSRAYTSGSRSVFRTGTIADTINTDYNTTDFARLNNITPTATGTITFTLSLIGSFHYMSGFTITESNATGRGITEPVPGESESENGKGEQIITQQRSVYPNPFTNELTVSFNAIAAGKFNIKLTDISGKIVLSKQISKQEDESIVKLNTSAVKSGMYFLHIHYPNGRQVFKVIRQ